MVKYYIKITDEKPLDEDSALWFELESDNETGKADFFVLDRNEYTALVQKFEDVQNSYDVVSANFNDSVIEEITPTIESYIASLPSTVDGAYSLVDSENGENTYDYSSLNGALEGIETDYNAKLATKLDISSVDNAMSARSTNPVQNNVVKSALDSKANSSHNHLSWISVQFNAYSWGHYNPELRIVEAFYYRDSYNFTKTSTYVLHSGLFKNFKPLGGDMALSSFFNTVRGRIENETGNLEVSATSTGTKNISFHGVWHY